MLNELNAIIDVLKEAKKQGYDLELFCEENLYNASPMDAFITAENLGMELSDAQATEISDICRADEQWQYLDHVRGV